MASKPRPEPRTAAERAADHRRQVTLQIWLPLVLGIVIVVGLSGLAVYGTVIGSSEVNRWGNISAVYVMLPTLFSSLLTITILILTIRGLSKLGRKLPGWLAAAQAFFAMVALRVHELADRMVAPVIAVNSSSGGLTDFFRSRAKSKKT